MRSNHLNAFADRSRIESKNAKENGGESLVEALLDDLQLHLKGQKPYMYGALIPYWKYHAPQVSNNSPAHDADVAKLLRERVQDVRNGNATVWVRVMFEYYWDNRRARFAEILALHGINLEEALSATQPPLKANYAATVTATGVTEKPVQSRGRDWEQAIARINEEASEKTGSLSLAGLAIRDVPEQISMVPWLEDVSIGDTMITSFGWMAYLTALKHLDISNTRFSRLSFPEAAHTLRYILCVNAALQDFSGLENCQSLETLNCQRTETLLRMDGIESCRSLRTLVCSNNFIRNIYPLRQLNSLVELVIPYTDLMSLDGLPETDTIRHMDFSSTRLSSLAGIERASQVRIVALRKNRLRSLAPLGKCKKISVVDLSGCVIDDINEEFWSQRSLKKVLLTGGRLGNLPSDALGGDESGNCLQSVREYLGIMA